VFKVAASGKLAIDEEDKDAFANVNVESEGQLPPPEVISTAEGIRDYTSKMKKMTEELPEHGSQLEYILVPLRSLIGRERVLMYELG